MTSYPNLPIRIGDAREDRKAAIRAGRARRQHRELAAAVSAPRRRKAAGLTLLVACLLWACLAGVLGVMLAGCLPLPASATPTASTTPTGTPAMATSSAGSLEREQQPAPSLTPTPGACLVSDTGGQVLNVRAEPSLAAAILGGLRPGQRVAVLSWGEQWHHVDSGSLTGYIFAAYCKAAIETSTSLSDVGTPAPKDGTK